MGLERGGWLKERLGYHFQSLKMSAPGLQLGILWQSSVRWMLIMNLGQEFLVEGTETQLLASKTTTPWSKF